MPFKKEYNYPLSNSHMFLLNYMTGISANESAFISSRNGGIDSCDKISRSDYQVRSLIFLKVSGNEEDSYIASRYKSLSKSKNSKNVTLRFVCIELGF